MKVKDLMTREPRTCSPDTTLAAATHLMWDGDCGILPVVDEMNTCRCRRRSGTCTSPSRHRNPRASHLTVGEVTGKQVWTCGPDDDVHTVLETMKTHRVRRLPVEGFGGTVLGIVSMNDVLLAAGPRKALRNDEVVDTFQGICAHHHPAPHVAAA